MPERNPAEADRSASDLIELSTCHDFAYWLALGAIPLAGRAAPSGHRKIRNLQATDSALGPPVQLALKALHPTDRTLKLLRQSSRPKYRLKDLSSAGALSNWTGFVVCFSLSVLRGTQIEASFCQAIRIAPEQKSISLAKYAENNLRRLPPADGKRDRGCGFRLPLL
jgi:hypothetical protein